MLLMRLLVCAALALSVTACGDGKPKAESVKKYCVLPSLPHKTAADFRAIQQRSRALFEQRKPYKVNPVNKRVIDAAMQLTAAAQAMALQKERPELFRGQPRDTGFQASRAELRAACTELSKVEPGPIPSAS